MSDLPPADWYTDPEDESQYRYWDGSAWTEHRAPRHADPEGAPATDEGGPRGPGALIGSTFSTTRRQWRGCTAAGLISVVAQVVLTALAAVAGNNILMGEFDEIWRRFNDPEGFDPTAPEHEAYFNSLEFDLSPINFAIIALALLIFWLGNILVQVAVTRLAVSDLRGRAEGVSDSFRQALPRIPRLMGVNLQVFAFFVAALAATVLAAVAVPVLLILLIPVLIAVCVVAFTVVPMAYAVASVGPAAPSLRYGLRLVRGRFWGVLGRLLLVYVVFFGVLVAVSVAFTIAAAEAGTLVQWASQAIQAVLGAAAGVLLLVAPAILYHDLGGESD